MKRLKFVLSSVALCASLASFSQSDTTKSTTGNAANSVHATTGTSVKTDTASGNSRHAATGANGIPSTQQSNTVNSNLPKPNFGRYYIPVLGTYQPAQTGANNQQVTVSGDEANPGKVWVEGLTPAKFYALLKTPGTYKIPAQTQDQNSVAEGTLTYDESSRQITICAGCGFSGNGAATATATTDAATDMHSAGVAGKGKNAKTAKAVLNFTGTKINQGTAGAF